MDFPFVKKKFSTPGAKNVIIMSDKSTAMRLIYAAMPRNFIKAAEISRFYEIRPLFQCVPTGAD